MRFLTKSGRGPTYHRRGLRGAPLLISLVVVAAVLVVGGVVLALGDDSATSEGSGVAPTATQAAPTAATEPSTQSALQAAPPAVAAELSQRAFPRGGAPNVLLANDTGSADALAASGLQGQLTAPLLLTDPDELSPETAAELERLGDPEIHILGGHNAIAFEIEQQLVEAGHTLHRHAGPTGAHTAVDIASRHFQSSRSAVLISMGEPGADPSQAVVESLPASSLAAAEAMPVLLTEPDRLSDVTAEYLSGSTTDEVYVVGDTSVISEDVVAEIRALRIRVRRVAGEDRFATAVEVARTRGFGDASDASVVVLAQGGQGQGDAAGAWPGSFIGSTNTGRFGGAPVMLVDGETLPEPTRAFLTPRTSATTFLLCAPGVPEANCDEARDLVRQAGTR